MAERKALGSREVFIDDYVAAPEVIDPAIQRAEHEKRVATLRVLWERRRFLARMTGLGMLLSLLIAVLLPNRYKSTTRLMPPDQNSTSGLGMLAALAGRGSGGSGLGLAGIASDVLGLKESGPLFVGILQSRTTQDDLIAKFDLRKLYHHKRWEDARKELSSYTDIEEDRKSGILTLSVTDKSPQRAAAMAAEYVEELNRVVTQLNTSSAHRERVFLEGRLNQVKQDLEAAEKDFSQFASKNTALDIPAQGRAMIQAAATLEGELIASQTELESLRQIYTDNNVRVRATQARVDELQRQMKKLGGQADVDTPIGSQDEQAMYPSIRRLPILGVNYADLFRRTKVQEAIFETLTQEYELAKVEEAKETPSVKVLDPGNIPEKKSSPHRTLIVLAGGLFFFFWGTVLILSGTAWNRIDPQDPGKVLAQEVLETIKSRIGVASTNGSGDGASSQIFGRRLLQHGSSSEQLRPSDSGEGRGSESPSRPGK